MFRLTLVILSLALGACDGGYAVECGQGVDREDCEQVAAFGSEAAEVAADRVHVETRDCARSFDPPPPDMKCWSVRVLTGDDRVVIPVAREEAGSFFEPTDRFPFDP